MAVEWWVAFATARVSILDGSQATEKVAHEIPAIGRSTPIGPDPTRLRLHRSCLDSASRARSGTDGEPHTTPQLRHRGSGRGMRQASTRPVLIVHRSLSAPYR